MGEASSPVTLLRNNLAAAACTLYKAVAVCAFGDCGVSLVCADRNTAERTVILRYHIMLTLGNCTLDRIVFLLVIHYEQLLFACRSILLI